MFGVHITIMLAKIIVAYVLVPLAANVAVQMASVSAKIAVAKLSVFQPLLKKMHVAQQKRSNLRVVSSTLKSPLRLEKRTGSASPFFIEYE